jgi:hypothetical protein
VSNKYHCPLCTQYMGEIRDATLRKGAGVICKPCIDLAHAAIAKASESYKRPYNWSARDQWEKV